MQFRTPEPLAFEIAGAWPVPHSLFLARGLCPFEAFDCLISGMVSLGLGSKSSALGMLVLL